VISPACFQTIDTGINIIVIVIIIVIVFLPSAAAVVVDDDVKFIEDRLILQEDINFYSFFFSK
jgi:hypothetical protein